MKKNSLIIGAILVTALFLSGCVSVALPDWSWELLQGEQLEIVIPQDAVDCCVSNSPEDVFASIFDDIAIIFQTQAGTIKSWSYARHLLGLPQTLTSILGDVTLAVNVNNDCTLIIERC